MMHSTASTPPARTGFMPAKLGTLMLPLPRSTPSAFRLASTAESAVDIGTAAKRDAMAA